MMDAGPWDSGFTVFAGGQDLMTEGGGRIPPGILDGEW